MSDIVTAYKGVRVEYHQTKELWVAPGIEYEHKSLRNVKAKIDKVGNVEEMLQTAVTVYEVPFSTHGVHRELREIKIIGKTSGGSLIVMKQAMGIGRVLREKRGLGTDLTIDRQGLEAALRAAREKMEQAKQLEQEADELLKGVRRLTLEDLNVETEDA